MTKWRAAGIASFVLGILWTFYFGSSGAYDGIANPVSWYGWVYYGANLALGILLVAFGGMLTLDSPKPRRRY